MIRDESSSRLGDTGQCVADRLGDFIKHVWFVNRQFAERLAVQLQVRQIQTVDESRIGQAAHFGGCLDTDDPQRTEITLTHPTIAAITFVT